VPSTATAPEPRPERTVAVLGTVAGWSGALGTGTVELAFPVGPLLVAIAGGGGELFTGKLALDAGIVRLDVGMRRGWLEARVGAVAVPLVVSSGRGDTTVVAGGGASVRVRVPVAGSLRALLAVGLDAFANRTEYVAATLPEVDTPWWAAWAGLGVEGAL
jgi:hypothetical protein